LDFASELDSVLPADLPHREIVIDKGSVHLALIVEANRFLNLTRITSPREAAIKHVLDSVIPWRLFAGAKHVLDAGTGAGFPGIPLALVLPEIRFTLAESIQKKARFVESALTALDIPNVTVSPTRAEDLAKGGTMDLITARAFAPLPRALQLLGPALKKGSRVLLYKGPEANQEIAEADREAKNRRVRIDVVARYELADSLGSRTMIELVGLTGR
jgi:16S rRNA (guanine527-N7)-methyltransferase